MNIDCALIYEGYLNSPILPGSSRTTMEQQVKRIRSIPMPEWMNGDHDRLFKYMVFQVNDILREMHEELMSVGLDYFFSRTRPYYIIKPEDHFAVWEPKMNLKLLRTTGGSWANDFRDFIGMRVSLEGDHLVEIAFKYQSERQKTYSIDPLSLSHAERKSFTRDDPDGPEESDDVTPPPPEDWSDVRRALKGIIMQLTDHIRGTEDLDDFDI